MTNQEGFNLWETKTPTNEDVQVVFTPASNVLKYQYQVIRDGQTSDPIPVNNNRPVTITMTDTGKYQIRIFTETATETREIASGIYQIDKEAPVLDVGESLIQMEEGSTLKPLEGIKAHDRQDGDLLKQVVTNYEDLDFTTLGIKDLVYTVSDSAGNTVTKTVHVQVIENNQNILFATQIGIFMILLGILCSILYYRRSVRLEKRISRYSVEPLQDNSLSVLDNMEHRYDRLNHKIGNLLSKSVFCTKYAKRYEKYLGILDKKYSRVMDIVATKFIMGILFLGIAIFSKTIQYEILHVYEWIFPFLVGFIFPNLVYEYKYRAYRNRLENDLLQAIIIMNNAFKSGRSITQAIDLVTHELDGPISEEFKKMHLEISFGLSIDVVFKRFAERVQLEEITYLTASLTILNKTGGNIIKVFSSIEKSLFNKKKLKLELASLTGSSKIVVIALFLVPILFIVFVSILNPTYFVPLYTTKMGIVLMIIMILMYLVYIYFVRKIMKVRM